MMHKTLLARLLKRYSFLLFILLVSQTAFSINHFENNYREYPQPKTGRLPVVIIPGLTGSELVNEKTGEQVWFSFGRAKGDDLRLPVSPDFKANRDDLVSRDILRSVKVSRLLPKIRIYRSIIDSLKKDGFSEGNIDEPTENGFEDTVYVFPYDWRRDNVENAHLLLQKLDKIRRKAKRPELRFNVVAHSMGGLLVRYAAMYGTADLTENMESSSWSGAEYFNNISLIGTPNGGTHLILETMIKGMSLTRGWNVNLPFVRDLSKFDAFTFPSLYQLLPHKGITRILDENLKELEVDIYSPETWEKYGWLAYADKEYESAFSPEEVSLSREYFQAVLGRAELFQSALNSNPIPAPSIRFYNFGADCKETMDGVVVYKSRKDDKWKTIYDASSFKKYNGTSVSKKSVKEAIFRPGDSQVTKASLDHGLESTESADSKEKPFTDVCGNHILLIRNDDVRKSIVRLFNLPANEPVG
ncbi:MAG: hypothetical protein HKN33_10775 [Pyrinomonadaceae bacterium]|nr:hypothetical protein [Pyrinomonadaceae bacterium]